MQDRGKPEDPFVELRKNALIGLGVMSSLAGGHRLAHYRLGSPGNRAIDGWVWIGAGFGFPIFLILWPPVDAFQSRNAALLWLTLVALAFLHSSAAYWSRARRHSQEIGEPIFGRLLEAPVAIAAALLAAALCGPGAGLFLAAGLVANEIQVGLIKARYRRMAQMQADAEFEAETFRSHVK